MFAVNLVARNQSADAFGNWASISLRSSVVTVISAIAVAHWAVNFGDLGDLWSDYYDNLNQAQREDHGLLMQITPLVQKGKIGPATQSEAFVINHIN